MGNRFNSLHTIAIDVFVEKPSEIVDINVIWTLGGGEGLVVKISTFNLILNYLRTYTLYTKYNILYKLYDLRTYTLMIWHDKQSRPHYQSNKQSWREIFFNPLLVKEKTLFLLFLGSHYGCPMCPITQKKNWKKYLCPVWDKISTLLLSHVPDEIISTTSHKPFTIL